MPRNISWVNIKMNHKQKARLGMWLAGIPMLMLLIFVGCVTVWWLPLAIVGGAMFLTCIVIGLVLMVTSPINEYYENEARKIRED